MYLRIRYTTKVYIHVDGSNTKTSQIIKCDIMKVDEKILWEKQWGAISILSPGSEYVKL